MVRTVAGWATVTTALTKRGGMQWSSTISCASGNESSFEAHVWDLLSATRWSSRPASPSSRPSIKQAQSRTGISTEKRPALPGVRMANGRIGPSRSRTKLAVASSVQGLKEELWIHRDLVGVVAVPFGRFDHPESTVGACTPDPRTSPPVPGLPGRQHTPGKPAPKSGRHITSHPARHPAERYDQGHEPLHRYKSAHQRVNWTGRRPFIGGQCSEPVDRLGEGVPSRAIDSKVTE